MMNAARNEKSDNRGQELEKEMILQVGAVCGAKRLMGRWSVGWSTGGERYVREGEAI